MLAAMLRTSCRLLRWASGGLHRTKVGETPTLRLWLRWRTDLIKLSILDIYFVHAEQSFNLVAEWAIRLAVHHHWILGILRLNLLGQSSRSPSLANT